MKIVKEMAITGFLIFVAASVLVGFAAAFFKVMELIFIA